MAVCGSESCQTTVCKSLAPIVHMYVYIYIYICILCMIFID